MAEELVIPDYQVTLLHHKKNLGVALSTEEEALVSSRPEAPLNEYFKYLQEVYPSRFQEIVKSTSISPIRNYRENYNAAQLLIKAYSSGLVNSLNQTPELSAFKSNYQQYRLVDGLRLYGGISLLAAFNVVIAIPKMRCLPSLLFQNTALAVAWFSGISPLVESRRRQMIPYLDLASKQNKAELFKLHSEHKLIYQYPHAIEDFPPDIYQDTNAQFLISKGIYEHAHRNDFNGFNRNVSQYIYYKENRHRLVR